MANTEAKVDDVERDEERKVIMKVKDVIPGAGVDRLASDRSRRGAGGRKNQTQVCTDGSQGVTLWSSCSPKAPSPKAVGAEATAGSLELRIPYHWSQTFNHVYISL